MDSVMLVVAVLAALLACKKMSPEEQAATRDKQLKTATAASDKLAKMHQAFPPPGKAQQQKCPDAEIAAAQKKRGDKSERMLTVDWQFLTHFAKPDAAVDEKTDKPWEFITNLWLRPLRHPSKWTKDDRAHDQAERASKLLEQHPYILVFRAKKRVLPVVPKGEDKYDPGLWLGWVGVFDIEHDKYVCFAKVAAENEEEIQEDDEGLLQETYEESAMKDLKKQLEKQTAKALKGISQKLEFSYF